MKRSKFLRLGKRDLINGLLIAVLSSVIVTLQQQLTTGSYSLKEIGIVALSAGLAYLSKFQSTHPHGVRLMSMISPMFFVGFNPRTRTGCDKKWDKFLSYHACFNPRTRTGCDSYSQKYYILWLYNYNFCEVNSKNNLRRGN